VSGNYLQVPEELVCVVFQNFVDSNSRFIVYDGVFFIREASLIFCTRICVYADYFFY